MKIRRQIQAAGLAVTAALCLLAPGIALAGAPVVYSPTVIAGQTELETRGSREHTNGIGTEYKYAFAVGHAFTSWWRPEVYLGRYERGTDGTTVYAGTELENIFQLAPTGKYWADLGFLFAYEFNPSSLESDKVEFGPLFEKRVGRALHQLNLLWEKGVGPGSSAKYEFKGAYSYRYAVTKLFAPGFEVFTSPSDSNYRAGPVIYGEKVFGASGHELEYSVGLLLPLNSSSPDTTFVFRLEYEIF